MFYQESLNYEADYDGVHYRIQALVLDDSPAIYRIIAHSSRRDAIVMHLDTGSPHDSIRSLRELHKCYDEIIDAFRNQHQA
jgi:hypothetical protein